jgi:hypothetical protein
MSGWNTTTAWITPLDKKNKVTFLLMVMMVVVAAWVRQCSYAIVELSLKKTKSISVLNE